MPFFKGHKTADILQQASVDDKFVSSTLYVQEQAPTPWSEGLAKVAPDSTGSGKLVQQPANSIHTTLFLGNPAASVLSTIRERLLYLNGGIIVNSLSQGLVTQDVILNISIWNGWPIDTTVTQIDITSGQGVLVSGVVVGTPITGLQEIPLNITVLANGPASFDATISIRLGITSEIFELQLIGIRISVPFLLDAEWVAGLSVSKSYLTSVATGSEMSETRSSLRANPIRKVEAPLFFGSTTSSLQAYSSLRAVGTSSFLMPYVPDRTSSTAPQAARTIYCDTTQRRFNVGGYALIAEYKSDGAVEKQEAIKIIEVYTDRIVSEFDTVNTYTGNTDIFPGMLCMPSLNGSAIEAVTGGVGTFILTADEIYGETMLHIENASYTPTVINNFPVYPFEINWADSVPIGVFRGGKVKASGSGQSYYTLGPGTGMSQSIISSLFGRDQSWEASGFFNYISGMGKAFWVRGRLDMFKVSDTTGGGGTGYVIDVDKSIKKSYLKDLKAVWAVSKSGDIDIVNVTSIVEEFDRTTILTASSSIPSGELDSIYDAMVVRLTSDKVTETFITEELSEISVVLKELVGAYE